MAAIIFDVRANKIMKDKGEEFQKNVYSLGISYEKWWESKPAWVTEYGDEGLCKFLKSLTPKYKPNTLWTKANYACNYLKLKYHCPFENSRYHVTNEFLKRNNQSYEPQKAKIFEIQGEHGLLQYWKKPVKTNIELLYSVMSMCAVFAADRSVEVSSFRVANVIILENEQKIEISIIRMKTKKRTQSHYIPSSPTFNPIPIFQEYMTCTHPKSKLDD